MFEKATKKRAKLRLALSGPAGSGKTYSALRVAAGMGGRVALIDTERGSASLYSDLFAFDVAELEPPYRPDKYVAAIEAADAAGYDVVIIDSLSHAWAGEGGILEWVDDIKETTRNKMTAWKEPTAAHNRLVNAILGMNAHCIITLRAKQSYAIETDARGKTTVRKLGMASIQRDGVEYEFTTVLTVGMDHFAQVDVAGKDRTGLFAKPCELSEETGEMLLAWLNQGEDTPKVPTVEQVRARIGEVMRAGEWPQAAIAELLRDNWSARTVADLPPSGRSDVMAILSEPLSADDFVSPTDTNPPNAQE